MARYVDEMITRFLVEGQDSLAKAFTGNASAAEKLSSHAGRAMNTLIGLSPQMQNVGQSGLQLAEGWSVAGAQAEKIGSTFDSLAKKQGFSPDAIRGMHDFATGMIDIAGVDDEDVLSGVSKLFSFGFNDAEKIKALMPVIAAQARDYGMTIDDSAKQIGRAISAGNVGMLTRSGVLTMDMHTRAEVAKAQALMKSGDAASYAAGQQLMYDLILQNSSKYASSNADYMETSAGKLAATGQQMDNLRENMGQGVNEAKAWEQQWGVSVIKTLGLTDEAAAKTVGKITYVGSKALDAGGQILGAVKGLREWQTATKLGDALGGKGGGGGLGGILGKSGPISISGGPISVNGGLAGGPGGIMGGIGGKAAAGGMFSAGNVALMAGTAILGWEVGSAISKWLDKETGYIDKWSGKAKTETGAATKDEIAESRARASKRLEGNAAYQGRAKSKRLPNGDVQVTTTLRQPGYGGQQIRDSVALR